MLVEAALAAKYSAVFTDVATGVAKEKLFVPPAGTKAVHIVEPPAPFLNVMTAAVEPEL